MRNIVGMEWRIIKSHSAPSFLFMKLLKMTNLIQMLIQKLNLIILENTFILISIYDLADAHKLSSYFLRIHLIWNACIMVYIYIYIYMYMFIYMCVCLSAAGCTY